MSSDQGIDYRGQVAIVTGAAGGIGFAIARELASRGAAVLVNDSGTTVQGDGTDPERARLAAAAIQAAGGTAAADTTAVGTPDSARAMVANAVKTFGKVDILVNAAGVARPCGFAEASDDNLALELQTNLLGPYALMRAVWPGMSERGYGRILNLSSNAALGIGSNTSYATAKAGLIGLTLDAAAEGRSRGILVNALMPVAYSRMIEGIPDPAFVSWFRNFMPADKVAAAIAYFLSANSAVTGHILSSGGGRLARVVFAENEGILGADSAESVAISLQVALDVGAITPIDSSAAELGRYTRAFPFDGGTPQLAEETVVGSHRTTTTQPR